MNPSGLGAGQFGMVYLATYSGQEVTFKVAVKMLQMDSDEVNPEDFKTEAEIMLRLNHPNIVRIIGVCMREEPWLIVLEYIRYGALKRLLQSCKSNQVELSPKEFCYMSRQLAAGLAYLHEQVRGEGRRGSGTSRSRSRKQETGRGNGWVEGGVFPSSANCRSCFLIFFLFFSGLCSYGHCGEECARPSQTHHQACRFRTGTRLFSCSTLFTLSCSNSNSLPSCSYS